MRTFASRVELIGPADKHIRYIPCALAQRMVVAGSANIAHANGKVRAIKLTETSNLVRIGDASVPTGPPTLRFTRWVRLNESATLVIEFHPRSLYE